MLQRSKIILFVIALFAISLHSDLMLAAKKIDNRAAAIIDNQIITNQQVVDSIEDQLYQAELKIYELKYNQLRTMLLIRLIKSHPFSRGMKADDFIKKYVTKNPSASEADVDRLIKTNKGPKEKINEAFRKQAKDFIIAQKSRQALDQWFSVQSKEHGVVINLKKPSRPKFEIPIGDSPVLGDANAPITLIEYSDFQCPFCARAEATVKQLIKDYPGKIKLVYKNFPLSNHDDAFIAAEAGFCAQEQSEAKFWQLHDIMFDDRKGLNLEGLVSKAKSIGLDLAKFESCVKNSKYALNVNKDIAEGSRFGVNSTPAFFVNGIMLLGAQPYEAFKKIIDEELRE
ncbi:MAG: DsbA family protein [Kangiellaceae bacterium]|nr:DsbA family protein [Kangiellaceae bacterium]